MTNEEDISNDLGVNIKKKSDETFELSQYHLVEKIINDVRLEVSKSFKARETPNGKPVLNKDEFSLGRYCVWNTG